MSTTPEPNLRARLPLHLTETRQEADPPAAGAAADATMHELRRLILGMAPEQLGQLRRDVDTLLADARAQDTAEARRAQVASVLREALIAREASDQGVSDALRPTISRVLQAAVRDEPRPLVEAVSPIIGPSIRRAVHDAIAGMLEAFDSLLNNAFSPRALAWRIEAWRTGRRYSEVVLLRTLVYRVEQVLLIHRETGLLLAHVALEQGVVRDPELVGGMLTAIKDFVADSFSADDESPVRTLQVGERKVLVEQGRLVVLAAIVRGSPPQALIVQLQTTLNTVEAAHGPLLQAFDGDATPFAAIRGLLQDCLQTQEVQRRPRRRPWLVPALILLCAALVLAVPGYLHLRERAVRDAALAALAAEPGILVTEVRRDGGDTLVSGLRDPLARDPETVIGAEAVAGMRWRWQLRPFLSTDPALLLARVQDALAPPPGVGLAFDDGVLRLTGEAPASWLRSLRDLAAGIPGIAAVDTAGLVAHDPAASLERLWAQAQAALRAEPGLLLIDAERDGRRVRVRGLRDALARDPLAVVGADAAAAFDWTQDWRGFASTDPALVLRRAEQMLAPPDGVRLRLNDGELVIAGEAPRAWADRLPALLPGLVGVTGYRTAGLRILDERRGPLEQVAQARREIEDAHLFFASSAASLRPDQLVRLDALAAAMRRLAAAAGALGLTPRFVVTGYADPTGSRQRNRALSLERALWVSEQLVARGVDARLFLTAQIGLGASSVAERRERLSRRRVGIDVLLLDEHGAHSALPASG